MKEKKHLIDEFLCIECSDVSKLDALISDVEEYLSKNGYDVQLKLISQACQEYKAESAANSYEKACEAAAPIFELIKTIDWGWLELQILAFAVGHTPHYTMGEELMQAAFNVLDDKFAGHENYEYTKLRFYFNFSWRLLRARYYDKADPADIQARFDHCIQQAISFCEKKGYTTFRLVLLVRQAVFYGDSDKILEYVDELEATKDKMWIKTTKDEVVEYFQCLGSKITTDLRNLIVGWQLQKRRKEIGMSAVELAGAIGVRTSTISLYERGDRGVVSARLCRVADVLGVDMSYFYGETSAEPINITTDVIAYKMVKLMSQMSEPEKEYLFEQAKGLIKLTRNIIIEEDE